jgi:hypothetical protein
VVYFVFHFIHYYCTFLTWNKHFNKKWRVKLVVWAKTIWMKFIDLLIFNATFSAISVLSWRLTLFGIYWSTLSKRTWAIFTYIWICVIFI